MMEAMLRALAEYKYLTVSHIIALEISKSKDKSRKYFLELMKEWLVGRQIHLAVTENAKRKGFLQRTRQEYLRYLTKQGANFLDGHTELDLPNIRYPKKPKRWLKNDYFHRVSTIFIHISWNKWVEESNGSENNFLVYYDQRKQSKAKRFEAETRLDLYWGKHFTPDVICSFKDQNGKYKLFCLEVYNGNNVGYVCSQLEKLFWILENTNKIENRIGVDVTPRILVVFDNESLLQKTTKRLQTNQNFRVHGIEQLLFFNLDERVWLEFHSFREALDSNSDHISLN